MNGEKQDIQLRLFAVANEFEGMEQQIVFHRIKGDGNFRTRHQARC
jgi:hypothetical protein